MTRRTVLAVVIVVIATAGIASLLICGSQRGEARESSEPVDPQIVAADTSFGFALFGKLHADDPNKNIFISPASISIALAMTYNGASGEVKQAMAKALGLQGMNLEQLNKANAAMLANMQWPGPGVTLNMANSLWAHEGIDFKSDFLQRNRDYYDAEISTLDFSDPTSKNRINGWIENKTDGRIRDMINQIGQNSILFLVNAIYFKGEWQDKFDTRDTRDGKFTLLDGSTKTVPMMNREDDFRCLDEPDFRAIELPYGKGRLSMYVFLPNKESSLNEFVGTLAPENWKKWMSGFRKGECVVSLPRFKVEYEVELNDALKAMGMGAAFVESSTGWKAMTPMPTVFIDKVLHKSFVEVNEEGTEAAAATVVEMATKALPPVPFEFIADHPFFFAIRDNKTGVMLFAGAVVDP